MNSFEAWGRSQGKRPSVLCSWFSPGYSEWFDDNLQGFTNYNGVDAIDTATKLGSGLQVTWSLDPVGGNYQSLLRGGKLRGGDDLTFDEWCLIINHHARSWRRKSGQPLHFRMLHEPNWHRSGCCPFNKDGSRREWWPSTIKKLYARFAEIAIYGGTRLEINSRLASNTGFKQPRIYVRSALLASLGFPGLYETGRVTPARFIKHQWAGLVPQSNERQGNEFWRYFPRPRHVDTIAVDIYDASSEYVPMLDQVCAYARKRGRQVSIPEIGLMPYFGDNPIKMREIRWFINQHPEIVFVGNFELDKRKATTPDAHDWRIANRRRTLRVWREMTKTYRYI